LIFTILIALWLIIAIARGWQRGLAATVIEMVSGFIIWFAAFFFYNDLASVMSAVPDLGTRLGAFFIIIIIGYILRHFLLKLAEVLKWIPIVKQANSIGGALISGVFNYLLIFATLSLALMIDTPWVQQQYAESKTAQFVVNKTPLINSNLIQNYLFQDDDANGTDTSPATTTGTDATSDSSSASSSSSGDVNAANSDTDASSSSGGFWSWLPWNK
jgi:uncharacterized membrane protein required for colicin V production